MQILFLRQFGRGQLKTKVVEITNLYSSFRKASLHRQFLSGTDTGIVTFVKFLFQFIQLIWTEGGSISTKFWLLRALSAVCAFVVFPFSICWSAPCQNTKQLVTRLVNDTIFFNRYKTNVNYSDHIIIWKNIDFKKFLSFLGIVLSQNLVDAISVNIK